ncbi:MAG: PIN domain-containing protein [Lachnospiraceae bacterium]|nr:PIN domain-containing protein [Lachnospiraceae bacterium]
MVVLIDTNVILDFLMTREPFYEASADIILKCANGELTGYIAFHSVANLWYILRRIPEDMRRKWMADICNCLYVASANHEEILDAINRDEFKDFEDCLQDKCAKTVDADYIVTRNTSDFLNSEVKAVLPEELLDIIKDD